MYTIVLTQQRGQDVCRNRHEIRNSVIVYRKNKGINDMKTIVLTQQRGQNVCRNNSTTNYLSWCKQVSIYLHVMDIYKYVDGSTHKLTDTTHLATWTRNDYIAKAAIISCQSEDFIDLRSDAHTGKDGWKVVEHHRDFRNSSTLHHRVQSFFSTKMQDTDVLPDHISSSEEKHT